MAQWLGRILVLAALAWLALGSNVAQARPSADRIARLRRDIQAVLQRTQMPGLGVALVDREGTIWVGGVGMAELPSETSGSPGRPVTADTMFRVGSITKSFLALAVAQLDERNVLDLDAPIESVLPSVQIDNRHDVPVTLAHALEHTAGFDDMRFNETFTTLEREKLPLLEVLAVNPNSRRVRWRPGSRMAYANPGYTVAAAAIEAGSGERFEDYVGREVLKPLGIEQWSFRWDPKLQGVLAQGYIGPREPTPYRAILHRPAGSLMLSPRQLAKFVHYWLVRGATAPAVASEATLDRIERNGTLSRPATDVDYGLGNYGNVFFGVPTRGHDGGVPGFVSTYQYSAELGVGWVLLFNGTFPTTAYIEIQRLVSAALVEGRETPSPPVADPEPDLERFAGYYEFSSPRHEIGAFADRLNFGMTISADDGRLFATFLDQQIPLIPTGPGRFRLPGESGTSIVFEETDSQPRLWFHNQYYERGSALYARARVLGLQWAIRLLTIALGLFALLAVMVLVTRRRERPWIRLSDLLALAPPTAAAACFWGYALVVRGLTFDEAATMNARTLAMFILSLAFATNASIAAAFNLRLLVLDRDGAVARWPLRLYATVASLAALGLAVYGTVNHLVGLRTWAW